MAAGETGTGGGGDPMARLEYWLDRAFRIPGTDIRFGFDALFGLIPGVGDTATAVVSGGLIVAALRRRARKRVVGRMVWNVAVDWLLGSIPIVGDIFDVAHRANTKNLRLLRDEMAFQAANASSA